MSAAGGKARRRRRAECSTVDGEPRLRRVHDGVAGRRDAVQELIVHAASHRFDPCAVAGSYHRIARGRAWPE
jgi:hypothetical protein